MKHISLLIVALILAPHVTPLYAQRPSSEFLQGQSSERREFFDEERDERRNFIDSSITERQEFVDDRRSGDTEVPIPEFRNDQRETRREFFDEEREERQDFLGEQREEQRIFLEERKKEDRVKIHEHVLERFEQTLENLSNIENRLGSKITELEAKEYDIAVAQTAWQEGAAELDSAEALVRTLADLFAAELPENDDEPDYSDVRLQIANIQESFTSVRSHFRESIELLKSVVETGVVEVGEETEAEVEEESGKPEAVESEEAELAETL